MIKNTVLDRKTRNKSEVYQKDNKSFKISQNDVNKSQKQQSSSLSARQYQPVVTQSLQESCNSGNNKNLSVRASKISYFKNTDSGYTPSA